MEREVTMREKLAQAIRKDVMAQQKTRGGVIDWGATVDAVLAVMEEPSEAMEEAGHTHIAGDDGGLCGLFRTMIQAIREGK